MDGKNMQKSSLNKNKFKFIVLSFVSTFLFISCGDPTNIQYSYDYSGRCYDAPNCLRCTQSHSCFWCVDSNYCTSIKGAFCESKKTAWKVEECSQDQ